MTGRGTRRGIGLALLAVLALPALAQAPEGRAVLTGTVVDAETGEALPGAHVFIAASMMGTATDADGRFRLAHVPPGAHRLVASMLGYTPQARDTLLRAGPYEITFALAPTVVEVGQITVEAARDARWQRRLQRFERLFLGESENAEATTLLNPEVLSFEGGWGRLRAAASAPLVIENRALGYRLTYFLKEFLYSGTTIKYDGEPLFEEMAPATHEEADRWAERRRRAYRGSFRHYLLALLAGRTGAEGFQTFRRLDLDNPASPDRRFRANPAKLLRDGPTPTEKLLRFNGFLEVVYQEEAEEYAFLRWQGRPSRPAGTQRSWLRLSDGPTLIDHTGEVLDPYGVTVYGYFAFERIADLLPKEYRPEF